jgi:hypothetical protein
MINTKKGGLQDEVITPKITHHSNTEAPHEVNSFPKNNLRQIAAFIGIKQHILFTFHFFILSTVPNGFHFSPNRALRQ